MPRCRIAFVVPVLRTRPLQVYTQAYKQSIARPITIAGGRGCSDRCGGGWWRQRRRQPSRARSRRRRSTLVWFRAIRSAWSVFQWYPLTIGRSRNQADPAGRGACVRSCVRTVRVYSRTYPFVDCHSLVRSGLFSPWRVANVHRLYFTHFSQPSNASWQRAARCAFLFTHPMVGDAQDRDIRDMNARRTAGGGSCYRDRVGIGTEIETLRTSRRHRVLIVSSQLPLRSYCKLCSDKKAVRSVRCLRPESLSRFRGASCQGCAARGLHRGRCTARHAQYFIFTVFPLRAKRNQPPGTPTRRTRSTLRVYFNCW